MTRPAQRHCRLVLPRLALAALVWLALGAGPSAETVLQNEPPELANRLRRERVVVLEEIGGSGRDSFIVALVLFEQPRSRVADLMRMSDRQVEYRPELLRAQTIGQLPDGRIDEQRIQILFSELVYRLRYRGDLEAGRLTWKLDQGFDNDLSRMDGFWELYRFEDASGRTLGRFGSNVDLGRGVPRFIQKGMSRKTVLAYVRNLRLWVDSEGTWRP